MSEAHKSHIVLAVGTILFVPLVQLQLRADIITQIGGDTRNFTILYTGGAGSQLHLSQVLLLEILEWGEGRDRQSRRQRHDQWKCRFLRIEYRPVQHHPLKNLKRLGQLQSDRCHKRPDQHQQFFIGRGRGGRF